VELLKRVRARITQHNVSMVAASVAFYALLAIFPAIIAMVTIYALVSDPTRIGEQLAPVVKAMPSDAGSLLTNQLTGAAEADHGGLTAGLVVSLLGTLWAASGGISALTKGLAIIFEAGERGFVRQKATALGLTLGALAATVVTLGLIAVFPAVIGHLGLGPAGRLGAQILRWVVLLGLVGFALSVLYRVAANRPADRWRFISWGVLTAMLVWIIGSIGFSLYVSNFGKYNQTYGALAAVIVLLLWLYLSAFAILLGAVVDAEVAVRRTGAPGPAAGSVDAPAGATGRKEGVVRSS